MLESMLAQLRDDEARGGVPRLTVYDDATGLPIRPGSVLTGHPTIGIGRALDTHGVSTAEAESMFAADVAAVESGLEGSLPFWRDLDPVRAGVLCNMGFELGVGGLLAFTHTLHAIQLAILTTRADLPDEAAQHWRAAAADMLDSAWARELAAFGSPRARRLAAQMVTGRADATTADLPADLGGGA